ncbi:MAG: hypothetical protein HKN58_10105 [Xanthomonadales bacterium]|nr:hypothetical protein [Xanthomonadales bacterium]
MTSFRKLAACALLVPVLAMDASAQPLDPDPVVLPLEARTCNLPNAPMRVPPDADFDLLAKAKPGIAEFQQDMLAYRACLDTAGKSDSLSDGNRVALTQAYNYSVEMEERIAEQFNIAVRNYKARQEEAQD